MSIEKSEIKKGTLNDVGNRLDDMLESAQKQKHGNNGAKQGLFACAKQIGGLAKIAEKELDEGKFDLEGMGHVKRFLARAQTIAENMGRQQENLELIASGKIEAFTAAVAAVKKQWEVEDAKSKLFEVEPLSQSGVVVGGGPVRRKIGEHPGPSLAQRRRAEASGTIEVVDATTEEVPEEPVPEPEKPSEAPFPPIEVLEAVVEGEGSLPNTAEEAVALSETTSSKKKKKKGKKSSNGKGDGKDS